MKHGDAPLIGIDFDNTIVSYDLVFHSIAVEQGLIAPTVLKSKEAVRNTLRAQGQEEEWIVLQGLVYGDRIKEAQCFEGFFEFIAWAAKQHLELAIISHKTRYPFRGPQYDLHEAARGWLAFNKLTQSEGGYIKDSLISFNEEKEGKIAKINELSCTLFIDDLPEILLHPDFNSETLKLLFDPYNHSNDDGKFFKASSWSDITQLVKTHVLRT